MMMFWLYLMACTVEQVSKGSTVEDTLGEHGLAVINHIQEKQATKGHFQRVQVWDGTDGEYGPLLGRILGATYIQHANDLDTSALLLAIVEPQITARLPKHPNMVAVLRGEWSEEDKSHLTKSTIGFSSLRASTQRYCLYSSASLETRVASVALDIATHFQLDLHVSSLTPESVDIGLWGKINQDWLSTDSQDIQAA